MNLKRILTYAVFGGSVLLAYILFDIVRGGNDAPPATDTPAREHERARPNFPVTYSLGSFDERFGISRERFLQLAADAKKVWEDAAGRILFQAGDDGELKVNLIFDWRQENLLKAQAARSELDEKGRSFDQMQAEYNDQARLLDETRRTLDELAQTSKSHMEEYNSHVARWNESKDHPAAEYTYLQERKRELEEEQHALERRTQEYNARGEDLGKLGESLNEMAGKHNLEVEKYNGTYVHTRDFEKGLYDGKSINIYEFEKEDDLKLTLVHEFGHAIGLGHVDNPKAIMCPKLALQDVTDIRLSADDLNLLSARMK